MDGDGVGWVSGYAGGKALSQSLGLNAPTAEQLRALPAGDILDAVTPQMYDAFHHVTDGHVFPQSVGLAFKMGTTIKCRS